MSQAATTEQSRTVGELLQLTERFLAQKGSDFPRLDAQVLLAHVLGCQRADLHGTRFAEPSTEEVRQRYRELIRRRVEGCPVAYLVGRKEFFLLALEVSPAVLIPRPDSETLVTACLDLAKKLPEPRVLDVGTGSGNLALAIAKQHQGARVTAADLSADALAVAQRNATRHGLAGRIRFLHGDLFGPIGDGEQFDFIVSNPPYIPRDEIPRLPAGVRDYEPHLALDGGPSGYAVFDRLAAQAQQHLVPGGYLFVEIGSPQEQAARQKLTSLPAYNVGPTIFDMAGHPRVLRAQRLVEG